MEGEEEALVRKMTIEEIKNLKYRYPFLVINKENAFLQELETLTLEELKVALFNMNCQLIEKTSSTVGKEVVNSLKALCTILLGKNVGEEIFRDDNGEFATMVGQEIGSYVGVLPPITRIFLKLVENTKRALDLNGVTPGENLPRPSGPPQ